MSAEAMDVPQGEVLLDGRVMRPDGSWSGVKVAGEVVRGTVGDSRPPMLMVPEGTRVVMHDVDGLMEGLISYRGAPPKYVFQEPVADVFYFETFMERLTRTLERRGTPAS